uniref:Transcription factor CBF/NF-Y/archaeal histone domain-containing protein n=1 Tax=Panagrolaimus sp. JU765 TaxID=591449 RepID=A0AC34RAB5_9BILA
MDIEDSAVNAPESEEVVIDADVDSEAVQVRRKTIPTQLPLSRIKKICKLDPEIQLLTSDAVKIISYCTERFIECFAKEMALIAKEDGRKTVQMKDLERAIKRNPLFEFLEDALTDWPEKDKHSDAVDENNEEAVNEEDDEGIVDDEIIEDDMDVDELNEENPVQITTESESLTEVLIED